MLRDKKICILGTGNMGEALVGGLISSASSKPQNIICTDVREAKLKTIQEESGVRTTPKNLEAVADADIIIYAVKPQIMAAVLNETAEKLDMSKLIISIAAGVPMEAIESCLNKKLRLIRVMPNIAAAVKEAATAVAAGKNATEEDIKLAMTVFNSIGRTCLLYTSDAADDTSEV